MILNEAARSHIYWALASFRCKRSKFDQTFSTLLHTTFLVLDPLYEGPDSDQEYYVHSPVSIVDSISSYKAQWLLDRRGTPLSPFL